MKLYFGKIKGNRYVLEIVRISKGWREADLKVVDGNDGEVIYGITREFSDKWGSWTDNGIRQAVLEEARGELSG